MPPQVEQFDRDASLMRYVAGEMPAADREALERRLAGDPSLAAELEALRAAERICYDALDRGDRQTRLPVGEGVAVRRVTRSMHQWLARRHAPAAEPKRRGLLLPWWCYPTAAAAAVIVAFLVWSVRQEVGPTEPVVGIGQFQEMQQDQLADWMDSSLAMDSENVVVAVDSILAAPTGSSSRPDDLNSIFLSPSEEIQ